MSDDFIRALQADWRAQRADAAVVVARLRRGRWTPHVILALEILGGVVGVASGAAFLALALSPEPLLLLLRLLELQPGFPPTSREMAAEVVQPIIAPIFAVAGVIMLIVQPLVTWRLVAARLGSLAWEDDTPEGVLRAGARRAGASLEANRIGRLVLWLLLGIVGVLWWFVAFGDLPAGIAAMQTVVYLASILGVWLWLDLRRERLRRELETCLRLLEEYEAP